jgi:hypothetical protein
VAYDSVAPEAVRSTGSKRCSYTNYGKKIGG